MGPENCAGDRSSAPPLPCRRGRAQSGLKSPPGERSWPMPTFITALCMRCLTSCAADILVTKAGPGTISKHQRRPPNGALQPFTRPGRRQRRCHREGFWDMGASPRPDRGALCLWFSIRNSACGSRKLPPGCTTSGSPPNRQNPGEKVGISLSYSIRRFGQSSLCHLESSFECCRFPL
jgi:hypothetical protein